jgi:ABC-2 type transport system ATP-binding protein
VITNVGPVRVIDESEHLPAAGLSPIAAAIEVENLTKSYGDVAAVAGLDLEIQAGEIFALLGPNGAGKTTTVEILEGYRHRDGGRVSVLGHDPDRERRQLKPRIGIVLQSTGVDRYLTVAETIAMYASYYPHPRPVGEIIELVGLVAKRDTRVIKLSGGQQRRLDVAIALAGDPDLLFLDEPTTGFDPSARREAWEVVKNLASLGKTVLLTTHYMDEAQYLADRVAVMAAGRIVATGTPEQLGGRHTEGVRIRFRVPAGTVLPDDLAGRTTGEGAVEIDPDDLSRTLHRLTGWSIDQGVELSQLEIIRKSLEDVYLELTGGTSVPEGVTPDGQVPAPASR